MPRSAKKGDGVLYFDLVTRKDDRVCELVRKAKNGDGVYEVVETVTDLTNVNLSGPIKFEDRDYKGKDIYRSMSLKFVDNEDNTVYIISSRFTNTSVALLNNLLNIENQIVPLDLSFRINKGGWPTIYVSEHGTDELIGFAIDFKDIPKMEEIKIGKGKTAWNSEKRDEFMEEKINAKFGVYGQQGAGDQSNSTQEVTETTKATKTKEGPNADDDDLPF